LETVTARTITARPGARQRILDAAYDLFAERGTARVGINEVVASAGVAKASLYSHFPSKEALVLAFLEERERRWTHGWVEAGALARSDTPEGRLLAIFDLFGEWFATRSFEGCSFINVLLESGGRRDGAGRASALHLENIRSVLRRLADEAGLRDPEAFVHSWHILMKGSIVAAAEGDRDAASRAQAMGRTLLEKHRPHP
jgi:AcrR family transcriptional regulator